MIPVARALHARTLHARALGCRTPGAREAASAGYGRTTVGGPVAIVPWLLVCLTVGGCGRMGYQSVSGAEQRFDGGSEVDSGMFVDAGDAKLDEATGIDTGVVDTGVLNADGGDSGSGDSGSGDAEMGDSGPLCDLGTLAHCVACDTPCVASDFSNVGTVECLSSECVIGACAAGYDDCDHDPSNGCEQSLRTLEHCSICGTPCALPNAAATCATGLCEIAACDSGYDDCDGVAGDGCETRLDTVDDCGGCGVECVSPNPLCSGGVCTAIECSGPQADCDGDGATCEATLGTLEHCGGCNRRCGDRNARFANADAACESNRCLAQCDLGFDDCDADIQNGCEASLDSVSSCGMCGRVCSGSQECVGRECVEVFTFPTTNFDPTTINPPDSGTTFGCGRTQFDSSSLAWSNWCSGQTSPAVIETSSLVILGFRSLTVQSGSTLGFVGNRPVAVAVFGEARIAGVVDASASGTTPGAGGNRSCGGSAGTDGAGSSSTGGGGGGGGGFGTSGADGGTGDDSGSRGQGGSARGNTTLSPLIGGCNGGSGGGCSGRTAGGGAVQISATSLCRVTGTVVADGANGANGCGSEGGGQGGGSGGAILIEARTLELSGTLRANGGRGGNGSAGGSGGSGGSASGGPTPGSSHHANGGGGGGGATGRILLRGSQACTLSGSRSPAATIDCP